MQTNIYKNRFQINNAINHKETINDYEYNL